MKGGELWPVRESVSLCFSDCKPFTCYSFFFFFSGCSGFSLMWAGLLHWSASQLGFGAPLLQWSVGASLHCSVRASHCGGFFCCRVQALAHTGFTTCHTQPKYLWHTGLVAPKHVEPSRIRDQTCVPWIGRWILIHCTTREVPPDILMHDYLGQTLTGLV